MKHFPWFTFPIPCSLALFFGFRLCRGAIEADNDVAHRFNYPFY
jgi:hypothetical protein